MTRAYAAARRRPYALAIAALVAVAFIAGPQVGANTPANKVAAAGSDIDEGEVGEEVVLLEATMRNAASKSLVIQVTLECSILTALTTTGTDLARAKSTLEVWVEVDGREVGVVPGTKDGRVTFCNREYQRETFFAGDDEDLVIDDFIRTKQAHGFNWVDPNPGHGVKEIVVKGMLTTDISSDPIQGQGDETTAEAEVFVGNRTLVVEPVDMARGGNGNGNG